MRYRYILYNQSVVPRESVHITPEEWFDISGVAIRQSLFASGNRVPFLKLWLGQLRQRFDSVGWNLPEEFHLPEFRNQLEKLLNRNRFFKGSRIELLIIPVFPSAELDCSPAFRCMAYAEETEHDFFPLNENGLSVGISERFINSAEPFLSSMVRSNLRALMIRQEAAQNGWDEIILPDQDGHLSETLDSNLFIKIHDELLTPSPATHCFPRIMTGLVRNLAVDCGLKVSESDSLGPDELEQADEVFITDDRYGLRWVLGFGRKRYYRKTSGILSEELNRLIRTTDQFQAGSSG